MTGLYHISVKIETYYLRGVPQPLGLKPPKSKGNGFSLKFIRRMKKIEALPPFQQKVLLQTIDNFLKGAVR